MITAMSTGNTNWKYGRSHFGIFRPVPVLTSAMKLSKPQPYFQEQKRAKIRDPIGKIRLLTRKSSLSRTPRLPIIVTSCHTLNDKTQGMLHRKIAGKRIYTAFLRDHRKLSMHVQMRFSNTAVTVEKLAKVMKTKKRAPQNWPHGILTKIFGSVAKMRDGPASASTPNAKHAGKMIMPAMMATNVSSAMPGSWRQS